MSGSMHFWIISSKQLIIYKACQSPPLMLLVAVSVFLGVSAVPSPRDLDSAVSLSSKGHVLEIVELWKRRVHDSGADSSSGSSDRCLKAKNVTRIIQNDDGYSSYHSSGVSRYIILSRFISNLQHRLVKTAPPGPLPLMAQTLPPL